MFLDLTAPQLMVMRSGARIPLAPVRAASLFTVIGEIPVGFAPDKELMPVTMQIATGGDAASRS